MEISVFLLALGAALRLTHLVVVDTITAPVRAFVQRRVLSSFGARGHRLWIFANEVINCLWCAGLWISFGVALVAANAGHTAWFSWSAAALTISYALAAIETVHDVIASHELPLPMDR